MLSFPNIVPNAIRSFEFPDYKITKKEFKNLDTNVKQTSFTGANTLLQLEFNLIDALKMQIIVDFWHVHQGNNAFTLPSTFYLLCCENFKNMLASIPNTTYWKIKEAPRITPLIWRGNTDSDCVSVVLTLESVIS